MEELRCSPTQVSWAVLNHGGYLCSSSACFSTHRYLLWLDCGLHRIQNVFLPRECFFCCCCSSSSGIVLSLVLLNYHIIDVWSIRFFPSIFPSFLLDFIKNAFFLARPWRSWLLWQHGFLEQTWWHWAGCTYFFKSMHLWKT